MRLQLLVLALFWVFSSRPLIAHTFWLEPQQFRVEENRQISFSLFVGDVFQGKEFVRHENHLVSFILHPAHKSQGSFAIPGVFGLKPAGTVKLPDNGAYVASYTSRFLPIKMSKARFVKHMNHEGLHELLQKVEVPEAGVIDSFARYCKSLILPKDISKQMTDRQLGLELEFVMQYYKHSGSKQREIQWQLLYKGRPLSDHPVSLHSKKAAKVIKAKTNKDGRVNFRDIGDGTFLVHTMYTMPEAAGLRWKSYWASTSFYLD